VPGSIGLSLEPIERLLGQLCAGLLLM